MRPSVAGLAAVLVGAAILRLWGLGSGIPYALGVDEPEIMERVVRMMKTGDFNPHFFDYPSLYFYVQLLVACVTFVVGATQGVWHSLERVGPADFYVWGRAVTAVLGVATIYVVYQIGLRWGARHALLAAALLAVMPNHVRESHFVLTDVPAAFLTTLTLLVSLQALEKGTPRSFGWAGAVAGLAAATKYNGGVAILLPLAAAYLRRSAERPRLRLALTALGCACAAFLLAAPYTVLDLPAFLNGYAGLASAIGPGGSGAEPGWLVYFKHLRLALGWPGFLLAVAGFGLGLVRSVRGPGQARFSLVSLFVVVYFYVIATKGQIYARYLLPIIPLVCVLAAVAVVSGVSLLRRFRIPRWARTALIIALTVAALLPPLVSSIGFVRQIGRTSTQALALTWIAANVPPGSHVALETRVLLLPETAYRVEYLPQLIQRDFASHIRAGVEYFVASSQAFGAAFENPASRAAEYAAYRQLFDQSTLLATFNPSRDHPGPELRIFKVPR